MSNEHRRIIRFMKLRHINMIVSLVLVIGAVVSLFFRPLAFGLDFTGGTQVDLMYQQPVNLGEVRSVLDSNGFEGAVVVYFGSDREVLVRLPQGIEQALGVSQDQVAIRLQETLQNNSASPVEIRRVEFVGPQVGDELREQGGLALLLALGTVMLYVAFRFQYKFAVGAVVGLIHDVLIVIGVFSVTQREVDLTVLAAVLAVIGYSINDSIVVADRIRENFRKLRIADPIEIFDISITETLDRTMFTSLTTLLTVVALFLFGGDTINNFAFALLVGISVGTYSSVYIAAGWTLLLRLKREDLLVPTKEELDDGRP